MARKMAEMKQAEYGILDGAAEPLPVPSTMREAVDMLKEYPTRRVWKCYRFVMFTLPGEEALKAEKDRTLQNPLFKYALGTLDRYDHVGRDIGLQFYEVIGNGLF